MNATTYLLIIGGVMLFSFAVQATLKSTYAKWGSVKNSAGITGAQAARHILDANGLRNVELEAAPGRLSDHYDPRSKTIRLSPEVYAVPSVSALAIAAHEAGHALQDDVGYKPLMLKHALIPVASAASSAAYVVYLGFAGARWLFGRPTLP